VGSGTELVDEGQSGRRVEEGGEYRVGSEAVLTPGPIPEGRRRQVVIAGELACRGSVAALLLTKVVEVCGGGRTVVAWGSDGAVRGGRLLWHSSAPWWRGLLN
jgi:hypothetical protein